MRTRSNLLPVVARRFRSATLAVGLVILLIIAVSLLTPVVVKLESRKWPPAINNNLLSQSQSRKSEAGIVGSNQGLANGNGVKGTGLEDAEKSLPAEETSWSAFTTTATPTITTKTTDRSSSNSLAVINSGSGWINNNNNNIPTTQSYPLLDKSVNFSVAFDLLGDDKSCEVIPHLELDRILRLRLFRSSNTVHDNCSKAGEYQLGKKISRRANPNFPC